MGKTYKIVMKLDASTKKYEDFASYFERNIYFSSNADVEYNTFTDRYDTIETNDIKTFRLLQKELKKRKIKFKLIVPRI